MTRQTGHPEPQPDQGDAPWSLQHVELYRESRELTHTLLQCLAGLVADRRGVAITPLLNRDGPGVESFLSASGDAHRLWSEALTSPFRLHGVAQGAFEVSRRPLEMAFPRHDPRLDSLHSLMLSFTLGAQRAARADPRLAVLLYGLSLSEARAIAPLSAASTVQLAGRLKVRIDESQVQRLRAALPARCIQLGPAQARQIVLALAGCAPDEMPARSGTAPDPILARVNAPASARDPHARKIRVRTDEIRQCFLTPQDSALVGAIAHLHQKGLKRPAVRALRGITKSALMLSGVGVKTPKGDSGLQLGERGDAIKALEWRKRDFAHHALLLTQIYRKLDPVARQELGVDPWAFAVASDLLHTVARNHPLSMYHQHHILRAYGAGQVEFVTCPVHRLEYLVSSESAEFAVATGCLACELAQGVTRDGTAEWNAGAGRGASTPMAPTRSQEMRA